MSAKIPLQKFALVLVRVQELSYCLRRLIVPFAVDSVTAARDLKDLILLQQRQCFLRPLWRYDRAAWKSGNDCAWFVTASVMVAATYCLVSADRSGGSSSTAARTNSGSLATTLAAMIAPIE
jgi:hypothetical protein